MTNSGGINITAVFRSEGLDLVEQQVVQANSAFQRFAAEQTQLYNQGVISSQTYLRSLQQEKGELDNLTGALNVQKQAADQANQATQDGVARNTSFASAIGTSRAATGDLVRELGSATGAGKEFTSTLTAALSGMGPQTVAIVAMAAALGVYTSWVKEATAAERALSEERVKGGASAVQSKEQLKALNVEADALAKQIASLENGMASADKRTRDLATTQAAAAGGVQHLREELDLLTKYIDGGGKLVDAYAGKNANLTVTFQEETQALYDLSAGYTAANEAAANFQRIMALGNKSKDTGAVRDEGGLSDVGAASVLGENFVKLYVAGAQSHMAAMKDAGKAIGTAFHAAASSAASAPISTPTFTAGGRNFDAEMAMTFASQSGAIQQKFVEAAGGNKDKAIQDWMTQHKSELLAELVANPAQFTGISGPLAGLTGSGAAGGQAASNTAAQGAQTADALKTGLGTQLQQWKPSVALAQAVQADRKGLEGVGSIVGQIIGVQAAQTLGGYLAGAAGDLANQLFNLLDGRYVMKPKAYVPPSG